MSGRPLNRLSVSVFRTCRPSSVVGGNQSVTCATLISNELFRGVEGGRPAGGRHDVDDVSARVLDENPGRIRHGRERPGRCGALQSRELPRADQRLCSANRPLGGKGARHLGIHDQGERDDDGAFYSPVGHLVSLDLSHDRSLANTVVPV